MKSGDSSKLNLFFALIASLTLGLAPFIPEPHLIGKLRWVFGGGTGMTLMDYLDLLMHGIPWIFLGYYMIKLLKRKTIGNNDVIQTFLQDPEVNLIDVREVAEFKQGSLQNAINMPLSELDRHIDKIQKMKGPKIFFCRSGNRSSQVIDSLIARDIDNCYNGGGLKQLGNLLLK